MVKQTVPAVNVQVSAEEVTAQERRMFALLTEWFAPGRKVLIQEPGPDGIIAGNGCKVIIISKH
jgi:hypothetical protein